MHIHVHVHVASYLGLTAIIQNVLKLNGKNMTG